MARGNKAPQPLHALLIEHRKDLAGWAWQQHNDLLAAFKFSLQKLSWRRAAWILERHRSGNDIGLAKIVFRHLDLARGKEGKQRSGNFGVAFQLQVQRFSHGLTSQIILSGAKPAHKDDD